MFGWFGKIFGETETNNSFYCWTSVQTSPLRIYIWEGFDLRVWLVISNHVESLNTAVSIRAIRIKAFQPVSEGGERGREAQQGEQWRYYWPVVVPLLPEGDLDTGNVEILQMILLTTYINTNQSWITWTASSRRQSSRSSWQTGWPRQWSDRPCCPCWRWWRSEPLPGEKSVWNKCFYKWLTDLWIISLHHLLESRSISSLQLI